MIVYTASTSVDIIVCSYNGQWIYMLWMQPRMYIGVDELRRIWTNGHTFLLYGLIQQHQTGEIELDLRTMREERRDGNQHRRQAKQYGNKIKGTRTIKNSLIFSRKKIAQNSDEPKIILDAFSSTAADI